MEALPPRLPIGVESPPVPEASADPLTAEHHRQLSAARKRRRPIERGGKLAAFNGWCAAVLAALSAPLGVFLPTALLAVVVLGLVSAAEFVGRRMLLRLDERGALVLAGNQVAFFLAVLAYCVWSTYRGLRGDGEVTAALAAALQMDEASAASLVRQLVVITYGLVVLGSAVLMGATAVFYLSRARHVRAYRAETPRWIVELEARLAE